MRKKLVSLLTVLGATTVLVLAANTVTYAATGHSFILGKVNKASTTTVLKRTTNGPALSLVTRPTAPPFTVTSTGKVANLNADTLDGLDSSALKTQTYVFTKDISSPVAAFWLTAPVPPGTYLVDYSAYLTSSPFTSLGSVTCVLVQHDGTSTRFMGESFYQTTDPVSGVTGSGVLTKTAESGAFVRLACQLPVPVVTHPDQPVQLSLTRVNTASSSSLRVAP